MFLGAVARARVSMCTVGDIPIYVSEVRVPLCSSNSDFYGCVSERDFIDTKFYFETQPTVNHRLRFSEYKKM